MTSQPPPQEQFGHDGFVARSRSRPDTVLTDHRQWVQLWQDARTRLIARGTVDFRSRWKGVQQPDCA